MNELLEYLSLIGLIAAMVMLIVLGILSQRLGRVTHARPYYIGLYIAALMIGTGTLIRFSNIRLAQNDTLYDNTIWPTFYNGLIAFGFTLGLIVAWRYWSWLIAERD